MEKPAKLRKGILKFLPGSAAAAIPFRSPPISPRTANPGKGNQGPTPSIIPKGAPRRLKSGSFDAREPSSPMVSCMGQIKSNKKMKKIHNPPKIKQVLPPQREAIIEENHRHTNDVMSKSQRQKQRSIIGGLLQGIKHGRKSKKNAVEDACLPPNIDTKLPYLGSVKKFASGRGALSDFDWRAYGAAVVPDCSYPSLGKEVERAEVITKLSYV
ncbi:hypothetical protein MLD38_031159 [Melastoma candidum]|uniref:Uncharacterized protein n=1 Tax=Melastoma candidum TaxID=119954 RepID=A0ACB9MNP4_9MYRT|nr:hypothetical protein MLD38_031159 [Melastoma candidum]